MTIGDNTNFWGPATGKAIAELLALLRSLEP